MTLKVVQPNIGWYTAISQQRGVSPRCPFASVQRCPRYYQSLSLLGRAGHTQIPPELDERLLARWKASDLWPVVDEQAVSVVGNGGEAKMFSNFCPEVAFDAFGLFAEFLSRAGDDLDHGLRHERLSREGADAGDYRWHWTSATPLHYTECSLYSPLLHSPPADRFEPPMFHPSSFPDRLTLRKLNGTVIENVRAAVSSNRIIIPDGSLLIEEGDALERHLSNGLTEHYTVDDRGFYEHGPQPHYQIKASKATAIPRSAPATTVYSVTGPNARINVHSSDASFNVAMDSAALLDRLATAIEAGVAVVDERRELLSRIDELRANAGTPKFLDAYQRFITGAANHMTIIAPFLPALGQLLSP
jgi:hypothetical protein